MQSTLLSEPIKYTQAESLNMKFTSYFLYQESDLCTAWSILYVFPSVRPACLFEYVLYPLLLYDILHWMESFGELPIFLPSISGVWQMIALWNRKFCKTLFLQGINYLPLFPMLWLTLWFLFNYRYISSKLESLSKYWIFIISVVKISLFNHSISTLVKFGNSLIVFLSSRF